MATVIEDGAVLPVVIIEAIVFTCGLVLSGIVTKNSLMILAPDKAAAQAKQEKSDFCGCVSLVHTMAFTHFLFFVVYSLSLFFVSTLLYSDVNCNVMQSFAFVAFIMLKQTQWGFFAARLILVFEETIYAVEQRTVRILATAGVVHFVVQMGLLVILLATTGAFQFSTVNGTYQVCTYTATNFSLWGLGVTATFFICDSIIMVTVVYGFIHRLLQMAASTKKQTQITKQIGLAHRAFIMYLYSVASSFILVGVSNVYGSNMVTYLLPYIDAFLNAVAILAAFKFGDFVYYRVCSPCNPCTHAILVSCTNCCCSDSSESFRELLVSVDVEEEKVLMHAVKSRTATSTSGSNRLMTASPHSVDTSTDFTASTQTTTDQVPSQTNGNSSP